MKLRASESTFAMVSKGSKIPSKKPIYLERSESVVWRESDPANNTWRPMPWPFWARVFEGVQAGDRVEARAATGVGVRFEDVSGTGKVAQHIEDVGDAASGSTVVPVDSLGMANHLASVRLVRGQTYHRYVLNPSHRQ